MKKHIVAIGMLISSAVAVPAHAMEFNTVVVEKSSITFTAKQMGVPVDGRFNRFAGQLTFDPAHPEKAKASLDLTLASIDAGSAEANDEVVGKAWFDVKQFPTARFVSTTLRSVGTNRYELTGQLSIKGRSCEIVLPLLMQTQGNSAVLDGTFVLKRADYSIGEGMWADFGTVANEIPVRVHLTVSAAPAASNTAKVAK